MPTVYDEWSFADNPFTTRPLQPNETGTRLLVGREAEVRLLVRRLTTPPKSVTVEGPNGIGKTSLINVAVHRAYQDFLDGKSKDLLIPCGRTFQLDTNSSAETFVQTVLYEVAQTLLLHTDRLKMSGRKLPEGTAVAKWLNSPQLASWQGGLQVLVGGLSGGKTSETNTGAGFATSGFRNLVSQWLAQAFPNGRGGGVVCILDNLELTETSVRARQLLEALRDAVLTIDGLRWVLCGSAGIVRSVASTPRLEGVLHAPIEVSGIDDHYAPDVLTSRVETFAQGVGWYLPLTPDDFELLYQSLRANLRNALSKADDYCNWVSDEGLCPATDPEKRATFSSWFETECAAASDAASRSLGNRAWQTFDTAVELGGSFSPSDFAAFGFESNQALRPSVRDLEDVGLLSSTQDDVDKRRKTIQVTAKGWMVASHRRRTAG